MKRALLLPVLLLLLAQISPAQPALDFKRVHVNWPTIDLYFSVGCNGNPAYNMTKQDFIILENNVEVKDFTLWCPDPGIRCDISVSLVFDVSGSMGGTGNAGAKAAGHAFVDLMNGVVDEATIVAFSSVVTVLQQMTYVKPMLHAAVDMLGAGGATAVWDGIYVGIEELINNGVNQGRAVVAMTDGGDNSSTRTPSEIISLANRNRIRVYTVGLGGAINATELQQIALLTGGKYYQTQNAGELAAIFQEIYTLIEQCFNECIITYERDCADGSLRQIDLELNNFCGGSESKTKSYLATLDSASFSDLHIALADVIGPGHTDIVLPLMLLTPLNDELLHPLSFKLLFDDACIQLQSASAPAGSLLEGVPVTVTPVSGGVVVATTSAKRITGNGKLMEIVFRSANPLDTLSCAIDVVDETLNQGCLLPIIEGAQVLFFPGSDIGAYLYLQRVESLVDRTKLYFTFWCNGSRLTQIDAQNLRLSSNGRTISSFQVICPPGAGDCIIEFEEPCPDGGLKTLTLQTFDLCDTSLTASIDYTAAASRKQIALSGPTHLCPGETLMLDAGPGYTSYLWSTGQSSRTIQVDSAGVYAVTVGPDPSGCTPLFTPVTVTASWVPHIEPAGPITTCVGKPVTLSVQGYVSYLWSTGETRNWLRVEKTGQYSVTVTDKAGCTMTAPPVIVQVTDSIHPVITADGPLNICEGERVVLDAGAGYERYNWSSGAKTRSITVTTSGVYSVVVFDQMGCRGTSDTVTVTVSPVPDPVINSNGPLEFCIGEQRTLDAGAGYAKYLWSTGETTRTIVVTTSGTFSVTVTSPEGCEGTSQEMEITVYPSPAVPVISRSGDVLTTGVAFKYQWYRNGVAIPGATNQFYIVTETGRYQVEVTNEFGCKAMSEGYDITVLGLGDLPAAVNRFEVYPEPNDGVFNVRLELASPLRVRLRVVDMIGRVAYEHSEQDVTGSRTWRIDLTHAAAGTYILHMDAGDGHLVRKVVKR